MNIDQGRFADALHRLDRYSPFLRRLAERFPDIVADPMPWIDDPLGMIEPILASDDPAPRRLRIARAQIALAVAIGDLSGAMPLESVVAALTGFADRALHEAIRIAIAERTPDADPVGFCAIALGKQGSGELNYSSDIDPILLYDPDSLPVRPGETADEAAVRIARRVIDLLQTRDGDGYVLRVDLRLRPSPEVTPIALPVGAAISYYESQALPWERAAFIRARAAAGDIGLGERFLDAIRPFVWRRSLDFGAVAELRLMSRRIRDHYAQGQRLGPGFDLKRGRGGIREVEFYAQIHQLIHGGRDPALRSGATLPALAALAEAGWIDASVAITMADGYRLLRTIEHRLQMIDDRQTHQLPVQADPLNAVAGLHGLADGDALIALLAPVCGPIGTAYDALDDGREERFPVNADDLDRWLTANGFAEPDQAVRRLAAWRSGGYPALRSPAAQTALEAALPGIMAALAAAADPQAALVRLDTLLSRLPSAINLFRLLEAQPALARLLGAILAHAPTLADALGRRADLLDGLIDASALDPIGSIETLAEDMRRGDARDYQALLDQVRQVVNERRFALGVQIVAAAADPLDVSRGYSRVAEAAVEVLAQATIEAFAERHGRVPDSELVILALGRLGGGALTHASDLDLIFLFTGDYLAESDGEKPLGAVLYYNRLAQRIIGALSVATASGPLYEVDTRLRPSGTQGPIAVSLAGFDRYQRESAWTWEHMALTRARPVFGSDAARAAVQASIDAVLAGDRPQRDIAQEAGAMRTEMAAHKPPQGPLDAKLLPGGLVDLEFAVHSLQLIHRTAFAADLGMAIDALIRQGLLPPAMEQAHDLLSRLLVTLRLVAPDAQEPPVATRGLIARAVGCEDWPTMLARFEAVRQEVVACWAAIAGTGAAEQE
ncbi:bifunctional [glutamine synthetase] adenylyltransferase/[glutamine synthetase]-adenylyl-L-tyrosine phosphorylase [Sphingomonas sp. FW199]|uniref:bifunctional [glutamine synthetase] adenylyltransferase/[glutamine synthetase]-adenylyl-L-tyrosine phosphorylase n=1 Tax=Sphingomonas sp. FW199 TaxID=3400217 RepID=UPI003CFA54BE